MAEKKAEKQVVTQDNAQGSEKMAKSAPTPGSPYKFCPKCGAKVHSRRKQCDCGYEFVSKSQLAKKKVSKKSSVKKQATKPAKAGAAVSEALQVQLLKEKERLERRLQAIETLLKGE